MGKVRRGNLRGEEEREDQGDETPRAARRCSGVDGVVWRDGRNWRRTAAFLHDAASNEREMVFIWAAFRSASALRWRKANNHWASGTQARCPTRIPRAVCVAIRFAIRCNIASK